MKRFTTYFCLMLICFFTTYGQTTDPKIAIHVLPDNPTSLDSIGVSINITPFGGGCTAVAALDTIRNDSIMIYVRYESDAKCWDGFSGDVSISYLDSGSYQVVVTLRDCDYGDGRLLRDDIEVSSGFRVLNASTDLLEKENTDRQMTFYDLSGKTFSSYSHNPIILIQNGRKVLIK